MFPRLIWCLALTLVAVFSQPARAGVAVTDDSGQTVRLTRPAGRIIALYGAFNEILAAMGLEDRIVARTNVDRIPPSIVKLPSIGTHMRPNIELILGYKPDLVLQMSGRSQALESLEALKRFGVTTALFKVSSFEDLFSVIGRIGVLTGAENESQRLIDSMKARLAGLQTVLNKADKQPKVFFEVRYPNLLCAGGGSMVSDIISRSGGGNCVTAQKKLVRLGEETLLRLDPDVYLVQKGPMNPSPTPLGERPHYQVLSAVKNGRVFVVDEQVFFQARPQKPGCGRNAFGLAASGTLPFRPRENQVKEGRMMETGTLYGIGVGPGDPELLTLKAIKNNAKSGRGLCSGFHQE